MNKREEKEVGWGVVVHHGGSGSMYTRFASLDRRQHGIQIQIIAEIHEIPTQGGNRHIPRYTDGDVKGRHWRGCMGGRIGNGIEVLDADSTLGEKIRHVLYNSGMIRRDHLGPVGDDVLRILAGCGAFALNGQLQLIRYARQGVFDLRDGAPISGYQHDDREFTPQCGHATILDIAATIENHAGKFANDTRTVLSQSG